MPDISELNGTAIDNVAEFDGLTVSTAPVPFTGLLDTYTGAAAGYSTRKLKTGVTVAARLRRSGDNIEADVEFDSNNEISLTSPISNASSGTYTDLADFVDHATTPRDAFVKEWKDQSGSGNHATQTATTSQPKLYDATTGLIIENGKPAAQFDGTNSYFDVPSTQWTDGQMMASIVLTGNTADDTYWVDSNNTTFRMFNGGSEHKFIAWPLTPIVISKGSSMASGQLLVTGRIGTQSEGYTLYENGSSVANTSTYTGSMPTTSLTAYIGQNNNNTQRYGGNMQELIHWSSNQTDDRPGIEENINSNYLIYQPTDAPTSGLLADYTGAAAAYSVRQLSDKAILCMRIRRDMGAGNPGDDDEINIGFDSNGDLDTQAIADFCTTGTGYVTRWWDQSTNGNHADQPVGGTGSNVNQPQIYNGTAVIEENGKPAITATALQRFDIASTPTFTDFTFTIVSKKTGTDTGIIAYDNSSGYLFVARSTGSPYMEAFVSPGADTIFSNSLSNTSLVGTEENNQILSYGYRSGTSAAAGMNGEVNSSATVGTDSFTLRTLLDYGGASSFSFSGEVQEIIFWGSSKDSDRSGIETNIDTYYQIPGM